MEDASSSSTTALALINVPNAALSYIVRCFECNDCKDVLKTLNVVMGRIIKMTLRVLSGIQASLVKDCAPQRI